jgi:hypothetical protein
VILYTHVHFYGQSNGKQASWLSTGPTAVDLMVRIKECNDLNLK